MEPNNYFHDYDQYYPGYTPQYSYWTVPSDTVYDNIPTGLEYEKEDGKVVEISLIGVYVAKIVKNVKRVRIEENQTTIEYSHNGQNHKLKILNDSYIMLHEVG